MSFTIIEQARPRLHRSELAVPGSNTRLFEKAAKSAADVIFLDVEDAVAPDDKEQARKNIIEALNDIDWGYKTMMIRINGLDTHYAYRDVIDVIEKAPRLDMVLIPKVGVPSDVYAIDMLITQVEQAIGREENPVGIEVLIATALGMANVAAIAQSSKRLEAMSFGVADYVHQANDQTLVVVLIEEIEALKNLDEILRVDYIDVFFVAPSDLSQTMGHIGNTGHPDVQKAIDEAIAKIVSSGRIAGTLVNDDNLAGYLDKGVKFIMTSWNGWVTRGAPQFMANVAAVTKA